MQQFEFMLFGAVSKSYVGFCIFCTFPTIKPI